jgi:hypothetical protein
MNNPFFDRPIINSPYDYPRCHRELDASGQPTQCILETRRKAEFITPIPKPRKQTGKAKQEQLARRRHRTLYRTPGLRTHRDRHQRDSFPRGQLTRLTQRQRLACHL